MRRPSHTLTSLQTHACRLISLHTDPTTLRHNHTPTFWRTASFTRRPSYTRTLLHTNSNTHTHTHTRTRTRTHTHRRFYTRFLKLWDPFTRSCTHQHFHTQSLHTKGFSRTHHLPIHTHTHRHHPRSIFSPMTDDLYFFFFVFAKQISVKKLVSVYCQTQFRPMTCSISILFHGIFHVIHQNSSVPRCYK